jgi:hypothetical protein
MGFDHVGNHQHILSGILRSARRGDTPAGEKLADLDNGKLIAMLEVKLVDRARKGWDWAVFDEAGIVLAHGRQKTRLAAKYQAERTLFEILARGWRQPCDTNSIRTRKTRRA